MKIDIELASDPGSSGDLERLLDGYTDQEVGVCIDYKGKLVQKGITSGGGGELLKFAITVTSVVSLNLVSNLIYDLLKGKVKSFWQGSTEVQVNLSEIVRMLEASLAIQNDGGPKAEQE